jgi:RNA polymerase sigma factor (sigma-70 family)
LARERFERLYREHADGLYAYLRWLCGDAGVAEDLLADVFERVIRSGRRYDPRKGSETTWLYAIAINLVRDHGRRTAAERRAVSRLGVEADRASRRGMETAVALRDEVAGAIGTLSPEEQEVVALRFGADLTVAQVAAALGEPTTTVEGRLYRGLRKLRAELEAGA